MPYSALYSRQPRFLPNSAAGLRRSQELNPNDGSAWFHGPPIRLSWHGVLPLCKDSRSAGIKTRRRLFANFAVHGVVVNWRWPCSTACPALFARPGSRMTTLFTVVFFIFTGGETFAGFIAPFLFAPRRHLRRRLTLYLAPFPPFLSPGPQLRFSVPSTSLFPQIGCGPGISRPSHWHSNRADPKAKPNDSHGDTTKQDWGLAQWQLGSREQADLQKYSAIPRSMLLPTLAPKAGACLALTGEKFNAQIHYQIMALGVLLDGSGFTPGAMRRRV